MARLKRPSSRNGAGRVLLISPQPFYEDRGTPIAVRHVVTALSQLGWSVDVLTYGVGADLELPGLRIFRVGKWLRFKSVPIGLSLRKLVLDVLLVGAMLRRVSAEKYDCMHVVEEAIYPALLIGRLAGIPLIYDMQSSLAEQLAMYRGFRFLRLQGLAQRLERMACKRADVIACSAGLASTVLGEPRARLAGEWIFPDRFDQSTIPGDRAALTSQFRIPQNRRLVVYAGNFQRYQGVSLLLGAASRVLAQYPNVTFVLIGVTARDERTLTTAYRELVDREDLVLIQRQPRSTVREILRIADIAVSPRTQGSNLPLKIFDYFTAGLPIVATDVPAHASQKDNGCLLVAPTHEGLARGILDLLENDELAATYRSRVRALSDTALTWARFRSQVEDIYRISQSGRKALGERPRENVANQ